jgi:hypothetical protein
MPNVTVHNLTGGPLPLQDPSGYSNFTRTLTPGATKTFYVDEDTLAHLQPVLDAEQAASRLTWSSVAAAQDAQVNVGGNTVNTYLTGLDTTAFAPTDVGKAAYLSAAGVVGKAKNDDLAHARVVGLYDGTSGRVVASGPVAGVPFTTLDGAPNVGDPVYLANSGDDGAGAGVGKLTAKPPTLAGYPTGTVIEPIGFCMDASDYTAHKKCVVCVRVEPTIVLQS